MIIEPLYRRLLGADFARLPPKVQALHDVRRVEVWSGRSDVVRGASRLSRIVATLMSLPPEGKGQELVFTLQVEGEVEIWTRAFEGKVFRSRQRAERGLVAERVGLVTLLMRPSVGADGRLALETAGMRVLGIPVPLAFATRISTGEWEEGGRYTFFAEAALPFIGRVVRYEGWLARDDTAVFSRSRR